MYILGINAVYHESSACLVKDGHVLCAVEEERFNRHKHAKVSTPSNTRQLPWSAIRYCLDSEGISLNDCEHIGYSYDPRTFHRGLRRWLEANPVEPPWEVDAESYATRHGAETFLQGVLSTERDIRTEGSFRGAFHYLSHHDCHAASTFNVSPFERAAVMVVDGIGEWAATTLYQGDGPVLEQIGEYRFPNSIGFLWEKMSLYLGFSKYDACKAMGLAAYGDHNATLAKFDKLITDAKSQTIDLSIMRHESPHFEQIEDLFGLPRRTEPVQEVTSGGGESKAYADIAAGLQHLTEEMILSALRRFDTSRYRNLCMAGGVALNCAANGKIVAEGLFDDIFIQPAANDAGTAIGAALLIWNEFLGKDRVWTFTNAYLGPEYGDTEIEDALKESGLPYRRSDNVAAETARLLVDGNIVGWFQGRLEWGPRALGNRSLLADPRRSDMREILNVKVKHRELYRPFCPSVLAEKNLEWFDPGKTVEAGKYMLTTSIARPDKRVQIPAVVHADGTVRVQEVHKSDNPRYHQLISEFEKLTGVPLVLNTSFNDSEPIVCSPQDAINTFRKTRIDYLVLGDFVASQENK